MKQLVLFLSLFLTINLFSQNDGKAFDNIVLKDSSIVSTLFSYPDSVYNSILIASTNSQGFAKLNEIQKTSSDSFKKLISGYNRSRQKQLWELTRYPELIPVLIKNKEKQQTELDEILKKYPNTIKNSASYFLKNEFKTLVEIDKIHQDFESKYKELVKSFPTNVRAAYDRLIGYPELITTLSENIQTTEAIGTLYKRSPNVIQQKADSLNFEIVKENGIEYENWKQGINKDTAVQNDLKEVAKNYSQDENYNDDVYGGPINKNETNKIYEIEPYPYWAGYPYWYERNFWYPYPWWYQTGFYWPLEGPIHFFGMPRYHFGWWYYNQPHNYFERHRNSTNYFDRHYQNRGNFNSDFNRSTRDFYRGRRK